MDSEPRARAVARAQKEIGFAYFFHRLSLPDTSSKTKKDRRLRSFCFWWSKTVNIRTESCDIGSFFTCHYNNGFIFENVFLLGARLMIEGLTDEE
jgi:hypothetical protein